MPEHFKALYWLTLFHMVMWLPYIINMIVKIGLLEAVGYRDQGGADKSPWAQRMKKAHYNGVENYVLFASLTFIAFLSKKTGAAFNSWSCWYLGFRVLHFIAYTFAIPWGRTLMFAGGLVCLAGMSWVICG